MLYVVLLLVLVALGLLVPALTSTQTHWAWLSVGASGAAAVALVLDWWLRRRSGTEGAPVSRVAPVAASSSASASTSDSGPVPAGREGGSPEVGDEPVAEPGEEDTDAADSLVVADLTDEVRVLDERPRYHLVECSWLAGRGSLALPINEARQLGFTPCAVCAPDASLAARSRSAAEPE
ncbi:hypothetical protein ACFV4N_30315 [Actinosynnema sp. NPDC059797]